MLGNDVLIMGLGIGRRLLGAGRFFHRKKRKRGILDEGVCGCDRVRVCSYGRIPGLGHGRV